RVGRGEEPAETRTADRGGGCSNFPGDRRTCRTPGAGLSCDSNPLTKKSPPSVSGSGTDSCSSCLSLARRAQPVSLEMGDLSCGLLHGRAIQLLGELPPTDVSHTSAWHRGEFR